MTSNTPTARPPRRRVSCSRRTKADGKPFFLAVGFVRPHVTFVAPRKYYKLYPAKDVTLPKKVEGDWDDIPKAGINYKTSRNLDLDMEREKKAIAAYFASGAYMDAQLGKVLATLKEQKLDQNTVVIFTSDHGFHLCEHDFWMKVSLMEESTRVPLLLAAPGKEPGVCDSFAELVDLYPTITEVCGLPIPEQIQGKNLAKTLDDPKYSVLDAAFCVSSNSFLYRTNRWAYIRHGRNGQNGKQLYDMEKDPKQYTNLAGVKEHAAVLNELDDQLTRRLMAIEDSDIRLKRKSNTTIRSDTVRQTLTLLLLLGCSTAWAAEPPRPPNIVFCFADDWGHYASCYTALDAKPTANSVIKTPNIDSVAKRGAMFRNAFVPAPSCTPCRSSLLSGRYFFNTGRGAILNGAVWDETIPTSPLMLRDGGYDLGKIAKVWSPGTPADAPIGKQQYAYQKSGMAFNQFSEQMTKAVKEGKSLEEARCTLLKMVEGNFAAFLKARDPKKPFFFWHGPTNVHRKWVKGSGKALWDINPDDLKGKLPKFLPDVPEVREDFADYLGEAQAFDAQVGVILKQLKDAGELDHTIVVISGDHGAPGFPGGKCNLYDFGTGVALVAAGPGISGPRVLDDFTNLMDLTPTFLDIGGVKHPNGLNGKSLWPELSSKKEGLVNPDRTWVITGRERHVAAARDGNLPYPQRALRTKDFLYVRNFAPDRYPLGSPKTVTATNAPTADALTNDTYAAFADMDASPTKAWLVEHRNDPQWKWHYEYAFAKRPAEELYDLKADPEQIKNLASDTEYEATRKKLAEQLLKELTAVGDPRVTEKDCRFEKPPFTEPSK